MSDLSPLPAGHLGFERIGRLCHDAPHLKPLAFEALLRAPLAHLVAPGSERVDTGEDSFVIWPAKMLAPDLGVPKPALVVFSDMKYFHAFMPENHLKCQTFANSPDFFSQTLRRAFGEPIVADPGQSHAVCFDHEDLRDWLAAWEETPATSDPFAQAHCEFAAPDDPPQLLLDRLSTFLVNWPDEVECAYLLRVRPHGSQAPYRCALAVACGDELVSERIRRAVPLLGWGLRSDEALSGYVPLDRHGPLKHHLAETRSPIYDRTMGRWLAPRRVTGV